MAAWLVKSSENPLPLNMLHFISSNKNKIARAEIFLKPHNIEFISKDVDVLEIQSDSIENIAENKALAAFEKLKQPLFVSDHGWEITALNGFPGSYMKYINEWFVPQDFLNLMNGKTNREMIFTEYLCYTDGKTTKLFNESIKGHILYESKGEANPWMTVASFSDDNTSIAQAIKDNPSAINESMVFGNFAKWYKEYLLL